MKPTFRFLAVAIALCAGLSSLPAQQATVNEMRTNGLRAFHEGRFEDAIPDLTALIDTLGSSKQPNTAAQLEIIYFNLALCHFFTGDFAQSGKVFADYIKKYPHGSRTAISTLYIADTLRFSRKYDEAIKAYEAALRRYSYTPDEKCDIYAAIARCHLAGDDWSAAREPLLKSFRNATDSLRRSRSATLLATAYLKTLDMEHIYRMVPFLLQRDSLAARSIAFNMAAFEAGDSLFHDERYREAFWMHRLVYPHDEVQVRAENFLDYLHKSLAYEQRTFTDPRRLIRLQEWIGETEAEIAALAEIENYDADLQYRIARGYMESHRYREACELFLHLHAFGESGRAEESLFYAFFCAARIQPWSRAYDIGRKYMDTYPAGEWYDDLTLLMGQMYAREQDWEKTILHLSEALRVSPQHQSAAECLFLLGYAHFMEEQFEQAIVRLRELRDRFPGSELVPDAVYWTAMSHMFAGDYAPAADSFDKVLMDHPDCRYAVDSAFRRAVCNYALGDLEIADQRLAAFISANPGSLLAGEATVLRGDVAGALGRLDDAVAFYQRALDFPPESVNIELYNHCAFQAGEILYDSEDYSAVLAHFERYIAKNRPDSNIPQALYWSGRAKWQQGEHAATLRYYLDKALEFGNDRSALGVDMILDEWVAATRKVSPEESAAAWTAMEKARGLAESRGDRVTTMRLARLRLFQPGLSDAARERILTSLMQPEDFTNASPAVLETILDAAVQRGQTDLATGIATLLVRDFTETDYALDARMFLASVALDRLAALPPNSDEAAACRAEAVKQLDVVREVYATSPEAAQALLLLARLHLDQGQAGEADQCYEAVLGVRGWSNLWPEALCGRGACAEARKDWLKATAYYERVFIMYAAHRAWCAKAYYRRALCLHRAYEDAKAIETLHAMLDQGAYDDFPEAALARDLLSRLERGK